MPTDAQKKAAAEKIIKIYNEAKKTKDFAALAKQNSEDTESAAKGGDLGYFRPGQLPPVVDKVVFATPVGQLTQIRPVEPRLQLYQGGRAARRNDIAAAGSEGEDRDVHPR